MRWLRAEGEEVWQSNPNPQCGYPDSAKPPWGCQGGGREGAGNGGGGPSSHSSS